MVQVQSDSVTVNKIMTRTKKDMRMVLRNFGFKGSHLKGGDIFNKGLNIATIVKVTK